MSRGSDTLRPWHDRVDQEAQVARAEVVAVSMSNNPMMSTKDVFLNAAIT